MHVLSDPNRPEGSSDESWEAGDSKSAFEDDQFTKELIANANAVPLLTVFQNYRIRGTETKWSMRCPFKSHAGGQERTPSFWYYPDTKTFKCYGCGNGGRSVKFVALMENISFVEAARQVLRLYGSEVDAGAIVYASDYSERLEMLIDFSDSIREFLQANANSVQALEEVEKLSAWFDRLYCSKKPSNDALKHIISTLKNKISEIKICPQF